MNLSSFLGKAVTSVWFISLCFVMIMAFWASLAVACVKCGMDACFVSLMQRMRDLNCPPHYPRSCIPIAIRSLANVSLVPYSTHINPSKPSSTSAPTPPRSVHIPTIPLSTSLLTPPFFFFHTPSTSLPPPDWASAALEERRDGGSIVRIARRLNPSGSFVDEEAMVTATTASATASSAWEGSKKMLLPTLMTSNVMGGLALVDFAFELVVEGGYNGTAASQSSLNSGSSSFSKPFTGAGR